MKKFNAAFWKWFGDSKVVDEKGQPLVVYHGTNKGFSVFRAMPRSDVGFYFSSSVDEAMQFSTWKGRSSAGKIMHCYLSIKNPVEHDFLGDLFEPYPVEQIIKKAMRDGNDGVIIRNIVNFEGGKTSDTYVAFSPNQIKRVDNDGTWDSDDSDIRSNPDELEQQAEKILRKLAKKPQGKS